MQDAPSKSAKRQRGQNAARVRQTKPARAEAPSLEPASNRAMRAANGARPSSKRRWMNSSRVAMPRPGSTTLPSAPASPKALYLHFTDKEALFQELIRTALVPLIGRLAAPPPAGGSARAALERFAQTFVQEIVATRRGDIVRLIIAEGARFPSVADFYYHEVVERGIAGMRALIELGIARGEIRQQGLTRFPQIVVAPAIVAVIWQGLFGGHAPLDATEMLRVHLDLIFGERGTA